MVQMATATTGLTYEQFQERFGKSDRPYEFWYGKAVPTSMPTWVHGLLQKLILRLLDDAGFTSASEVELRVIPEAHPRPDVIAVKSIRPTGAYPTMGVDVVVEIITEDDKMQHLREKFRRYQEWGCGLIYVVDPSDRSVCEWRDGSLMVKEILASIPTQKFWEELDKVYSE